VLLIACANVTSLILGRMEARRREFAVRTALGASGRQIARQVMIEGLLLTVVGSLVGLLLLRMSGGVLRGVMFPMARRLPLDLSIDARGWFAALVAVAVVGIGLAVVPALAARRRDVSRALTQRSDRAASGRLRAGRALCIVQFALALPLVVCASLLARSIINLRQIDLGFDTSGVAIIRLDATRNDYSPSRLVMTYRSAIDALRAVPGVRAVSATRYSPLSGSRSTNSFRIEGIPSRPDEGLDLQVMYVDPDYFRTLSVPLRSGREFTRADDPRLRNVAVVSESFARRHLGSPEAALGRRLGLDFDSTGKNDIVIIGVAPDARLNSPRVATPDVIYQPFLADSNNVGSATLLAATSRSARPRQEFSHGC
jgi:hypothetical protein